tara:strand:- start:167910 stop:168446 length:537 start_codon:yes stop_codon:yes gene_type:complete
VDYNDQLKTLSECIFALESSSTTDLEEILESGSLANVQVYKNRLIETVSRVLRVHYPATYLRANDVHFKRLCVSFIVDIGITTYNIDDLARRFSSFLEETVGDHEDELLVQLAKIDQLWSFASLDGISEVTVLSGTLYIWQDIIANQPSNRSFDPSKFETIELAEVAGEPVLRLISSI